MFEVWQTPARSDPAVRRWQAIPNSGCRGRERADMQRVLIIEDNPDVQKALSLLLELHQIDSRSASGPEEGLAILAREPVDLVIDQPGMGMKRRGTT